MREELFVLSTQLLHHSHALTFYGLSQQHISTPEKFDNQVGHVWVVRGAYLFIIYYCRY